MKQRPLGAKIFGILAILFGVVYLYFGFVVLVTNLFDTGWTWGFSLQMGVVFLSIGLVGLLTGVGILRLLNWARRLVLIQVLVFIGWAVYAVIAGTEEGDDWKLILLDLSIPLVLQALIVWYFLRPSVKAQFVAKGR